jgi:hypothetical protein
MPGHFNGRASFVSAWTETTAFGGLGPSTIVTGCGRRLRDRRLDAVLTNVKVGCSSCFGATFGGWSSQREDGDLKLVVADAGIRDVGLEYQVGSNRS